MKNLEKTMEQMPNSFTSCEFNKMEETSKNNETAQFGIGDVMHRTWKILLIVGLLGLITELIFMIVKLAIVGNQVEGIYATIWFASSMMCLMTSGLIVGFIYGKPYIRKLWDWVYGA